VSFIKGPLIEDSQLTLLTNLALRKILRLKNMKDQEKIKWEQIESEKEIEEA